MAVFRDVESRAAATRLRRALPQARQWIVADNAPSTEVAK